MAEQDRALAVAGRRNGLFRRAVEWLGWVRPEVETVALALPPAREAEPNSPPPGPSQREYRELPAQAFPEWDRVGIVRAILKELEQGNFFRAAMLSVFQQRDDRLAGCWRVRTDTLLGVPLEFDPAMVDGRVTPETETIAEAAEVDWPKMFPDGSVDDLFRQGKDLGFAVGELLVAEDEETGRWVPRLKTWHTQWVWWNWATESYWINTAGAYDEAGVPRNDGAGVIELPRVDREVYSDGHWIVYAPYGFRYAFQRGIIRSTAELHLMRQWNRRDWARYNEVYGLLIRKAVVPSGASEPDKDRFASSIRNMGSETTVECPVPEQGAGFDIQIAAAPTGAGFDTFGNALKYVDECIGNAILGQSAAGERKTGLGDGQANQDESVRQDILEKDARIYEVLKQQALSWWCLWNFGDRRLCPTPVALVEPPETESKLAERLKAAAEAIEAARRAHPRADITAMADQLGIPLLAEGETPETPPPVEADPAAGTGDESTLSVRTLRATPRKRRVLYTDRLATAATLHGAAAMRGDVAEIKRAVREAKDPADLKARLVELYRGMDPRRFADVVERANVMAELEGRHDVIEQV